MSLEASLSLERGNTGFGFSYESAPTCAVTAQDCSASQLDATGSVIDRGLTWSCAAVAKVDPMMGS